MNYRGLRITGDKNSVYRMEVQQIITFYAFIGILVLLLKIKDIFFTKVIPYLKMWARAKFT